MDIRELRKQTGLSQSEFAKKFHLRKGTLANWEQGIRKPPEHVAYMIEHILKQEQALDNILTRIIQEKRKDRSKYFLPEEICEAYHNAFYIAIDIVDEEKNHL